MPITALLLVAQPVPAPAGPPPAGPPPAQPCRAAQLRLTADGHGGDLDGMSHSGTELSIRNLGADCILPALPLVRFLDARGRTLAAVRQVPPGMHPGPAMVPVRLAGGHRATADLRWISGPVFPQNRWVRAARVSVCIGNGVQTATLEATLYGAAGRPVTFEQPPLRASEGMAAG